MRWKERKVRYMNELDRKLQMLQTEATTLSALVTLLQDSTFLVYYEFKKQIVIAQKAGKS
ncbi:transcription factor VIP1-like [Pyrus ussuriensis x Pyrus communis]|uniref:Transcription factor VIP1-like n=1 Tax=Pyrus ussuriensis x Pyrus communis TaxID=2448454 RepID=A0A5N5FN94_9ROSA|nr:transcription factor VIP1-like [Pyrus ussuriensis x Pyrus communis]